MLSHTRTLSLRRAIQRTYTPDINDYDEVHVMSTQISSAVLNSWRKFLEESEGPRPDWGSTSHSPEYPLSCAHSTRLSELSKMLLSFHTQFAMVHDLHSPPLVVQHLSAELKFCQQISNLGKIALKSPKILTSSSCKSSSTLTTVSFFCIRTLFKLTTTRESYKSSVWDH